MPIVLLNPMIWLFLLALHNSITIIEVKANNFIYCKACKIGQINQINQIDNRKWNSYLVYMKYKRKAHQWKRSL